MIKIKVITGKDGISDAREVRRQVFQTEQGIDEMLDLDGHDEEADHLVAYNDSKSVGTLRIRYPRDKIAKLERLAVLKDFRGTGIGRQLLDFALEHLRKKGIEEIYLNSQEHAKGFYEKAGFVQKGQAFEEAGIPHMKMHKKL